MNNKKRVGDRTEPCGTPLGLGEEQSARKLEMKEQRKR